jgi:hypothetical protein
VWFRVQKLTVRKQLALRINHLRMQRISDLLVYGAESDGL